MMKPHTFVVAVVGSLLTFAFVAGCDEKKPTDATPSATVSATATAAPTIAASASATAEPTASAAPSAAPSSSTSMITGDAKDVVLTVKDPSKEPEKTIKAQSGGSITVFLPDTGGNVWTVEPNATLGKAKEEVIPGFAKDTMGHQFKWETKAAKAGSKLKVQFGNKKASDKAAKPTSTFVLNIEVT